MPLCTWWECATVHMVEVYHCAHGGSVPLCTWWECTTVHMVGMYHCAHGGNVCTLRNIMHAVCTCMLLHTYMHTYVHVHACCMYMHTYVHVHACCMYIHTYMYMHAVYSTYMHAVCTYIHVCTYIPIYMCEHGYYVHNKCPRISMHVHAWTCNMSPHAFTYHTICIYMSQYGTAQLCGKVQGTGLPVICGTE